MMVTSEDYRGKRVLITGGLGFIGSNIAHKLVRRGARVTIIDSLAPLYGGNLTNVKEIRDDLVLHIGDIRNESLVRPLVTGADIIFHLAAQVSYIDSSRIPLDDLDVNARGTLQLLELCHQNNRDARVVFASSRLVLGKIVEQPVREDHPTEPLSLYGVHKLAAEKYHRLYASLYGMKTAVLRITNPYGERQQLKHSKYSMPGWFMRLAVEGIPIKIFGDGNQLRDYIYATDIAEAFLSVGLAPLAGGEIFNCGFGQSVPFRTMAETVVRVLKKGSIEYVPWPENYEQVETGDVHFDTGKLNGATGWRPSVSLEQGIERMYAYYDSRWSHYV
jgi:UDP-glucose 4-epimerase